MLKNRSRLLRYFVFGLVCSIYVSALTGTSSWTGASRLDLRNTQSDRFADAKINGVQPYSPLMRSILNPSESDPVSPLAKAATRASMTSPLAATLTATKTATIVSDDGDGKADPGETIMYTVTITNTGGMDATNVVFSDMVDSNTTYQNGSIASSPVAFDDSFTASGNIPISIAAPGVLTNDVDPDTGNNTGLTVTQVQGAPGNVGTPTNTTATGIGGVHGTVTLNANGGFTYEPPPGFTGSDTFTYKISDGAKTSDVAATVTITISGMAWFIDNSASSSLNRGTFSQPFKTIAAFNTVNTGAAPNPQPGDSIALRTGTGTYSETDGINLRDNQKLVGEAVAFNTVLTADANSSSAYQTFAAGTNTAPVITTSAGNGVDLGSGNTIKGLNVNNTPGFFGFNGGAVGNLVIGTVSKTGTGGAINITTSGAFGSNVSFSTLESTSSPNSNLNLVSVTGTLGITSGGTGLSGSAAASAAININGGSVSLTYPGNVTKATTGSLLSVTNGHTGTLTFNTGTLSATAGDGLQFNNADGTYNFNGTTTLNGGDAGVDILNGSGGTFSFSTGASITSPTGAAFNVGATPGAPNVTYSGSITQNTSGQRVVNIDGTTGGTITFQTGTITGGANSAGININNANGNVTFSNGMTLGTSGARMVNQAVTITGGTGTYSLGAVSIFTTGTAKGIVSTDHSGTVGTTSGTVNSAGATAVQVTHASSTTALQISLTSVSANGGTSGITLTNTTGSFTVTGSGTANSGGTIQNTSSGIDLTNAQNVSLTLMLLTTITNNGINASNLKGTCLVDNTTITAWGNTNTGDGIHLVNNNADLTKLTVSASTFSSAPNGNDGIFMEAQGTSSMALTVQSSCSFTGLFGDGVQVNGITGSTGTVNVTIKNSSFTNAAASTGNGGISLNPFGDVNMFVNIDSNTFDTLMRPVTNLGAISMTNGLTANADITIQNNTINNIVGARGITFTGDGTSVNKLKIDNNTIDRLGSTSKHGISVNLTSSGAGTTASGDVIVSNNHIGQAANLWTAGDGTGNGVLLQTQSSTTMKASLTGNVVSANTTSVIEVMRVRAINTSMLDATVTGNNLTDTSGSHVEFDASTGTSSSAGGTICLNISGNTVPASGVGVIQINENTSGTINVTQASSAAVSTANTNATVNVTGTPQFGQPACATPTAPMLPSIVSVPADFKAQAQAAAVSDGDESALSEITDLLKLDHRREPLEGNVARLEQGHLDWMVQAAINRWQLAGIPPEDIARMAQLRFEIADLPGNQLAAKSSDAIQIDETAAGYGWFFDETPQEDDEFRVGVPGLELQTTEISPAHGRVDLLTVLMRELGKVYLEGKKKTPKPMRPLMENSLAPGVRRLPDASQIQFIIAQALTQSQTAKVASEPSSDVTAANGTDASGSQSASDQVNGDSAATRSNAAQIPASARYAVFNPVADKPTATAAVMNVKKIKAATASRANSARRVASFMPAGGPPNVGPFTLPAGKSVTIMFSVTVNTPVSPISSSQVCNQGTVTADGGISVQTDDPGVVGAANPTCTSLATADLEIVSKTDDVDPVPAGNNLTYTISFRNNGPDNSINVKVTDPIPANTTFVSVGALPAGWSRTDSVAVGGTGTITFEKANVANGETATFTITVQVGSSVAGGTVISNTASTTSDKADTTQSNNSKTETTTVSSQADLAITKTNGVTSLIPGNQTTYTIVVTNNGPNLVNGATITDTFPAGLTNVTWTSVAAGGATGNTASGSGNISETVNLPVSSTITYTVTGTVSPSATGSLSNTATVGVPSGTSDPTPGNNSATDTDTLTPQGDLSITKTDGATTEIPGTTVTYTITVSNAGPSTATGATVADTFPATITGVAFTSMASGGATGNTAAGSGNISDTLTMPPGSSVTYTATGTISSAATESLSNTATVTAPGGFTDTNNGNDSATDTDTLTPQSDLSITKTDGSTTEVPGTTVTYTIVVTNTGPSDVTGASVADTFPATITGVTFTSVAAGGATGNTASGSSNINDTLNMPAGSSVTYTATGTISASATETLSNTATVSAASDQNTGDNSATDTDTLTPQGDLAITKTDGVTSAVPGNSVTYTIVVSNSGPSTATGATVADTFSASFTSVTWTSVSSGGATGNTASGTGNINDTVNMPSGSSITYTVTGTISASAAGTLSNTATVTAPSGFTDGTPGNNSATDTDTLTPQADLQITKSDSPDPVAASSNLTYTLSFVNNGPSNAASVTVSDTLPASFVGLVSVTTPAGWTRTDSVPVGGTGTITFTKASVTASETATFTIVVSVSVSTPNNTVLSNTANTSSSTTDPTSGNNSSAATTTVIAQADLAVSKTDSPDPACVNGDITYTISFANSGPGSGINTTVTDAVPANTTFVSAGVTSGTGWTITSPAVGGTGNVQFSKSSTANGETATFQIVVRISSGTAGGTTITNSAVAASQIQDPTPGNNTGTTSTTVDPTPPVMNCPANVTGKTLNPGDPNGLVIYPTPTATDNCAVASVVCSPPSGSSFPVGQTAVTCTATDTAGNTTSCSFMVTVFDVCIEQDGNPNRSVLFNSFTGDYVFCCGDFKTSGRGTITKSSTTITLQHNPADRRVIARISLTQKTGAGTLQMPPGTTRCTISDSDYRNNACNCSVP